MYTKKRKSFRLFKYDKRNYFLSVLTRVDSVKYGISGISVSLLKVYTTPHPFFSQTDEILEGSFSFIRCWPCATPKSEIFKNSQRQNTKIANTSALQKASAEILPTLCLSSSIVSLRNLKVIKTEFFIFSGGSYWFGWI